MDPRVANHTVADLVYMSQLLKSSSLSTSKKARIQAEVDITKPVNYSEKDAICPDGSDIKIYWDSLLDTNLDVCQNNNIIAFADYTK